MTVTFPLLWRFNMWISKLNGLPIGHFEADDNHEWCETLGDYLSLVDRCFSERKWPISIRMFENIEQTKRLYDSETL